MESVMNLFPEI